jgi:hypothetical protein
MKLYHGYDTEGFYTASRQARRDPGVPGTEDSPNYLLPAKSTFSAPPQLGQAHLRARIMADKTTWEVVEDWRGTIVWDTATKVSSIISEVGPMPSGVTTISPGPLSKWDGSKWVDDPLLHEAAARVQRNTLIADVEWVIRRHDDQTALVAAGQLIGTSLTDEQVLTVRSYIQALRDHMSGWFMNKPWPALPECLA